MKKKNPLKRGMGFTLIELLISISIMALMSLLSWRGMDGILQAKEQLAVRVDNVQTLHSSLTQISTDLDESAYQPGHPSIDWDGRALRILRRGVLKPGEGLYVVAWSIKNENGTRLWMRWKSTEVRTRLELNRAWSSAADWAQSKTDKTQTQAAAPLDAWEVYFLRKNAWTNPMSSASNQETQEVPIGNESPAPDGVRLVLQLPKGQGITGTLTRDWLSHSEGGRR